MDNNISILKKEECVGCRSCLISCPQKSIAMNCDEEGFFYPMIDSSCIYCGICVKKCPVIQFENNNSYKQEFYGLYSNNRTLLQKSSSGGVFSTIANDILEKEGVVFGASYVDNLDVKQIVVDTTTDLKKLQGSKYVTSSTENTFLEVKDLLLQGKMVLYSGVPCQIAGLKTFLGKNYPNLYTIDLVCHGTPSLKLFKKYIDWLGKKNGGEISNYNFRDKTQGKWGHVGSYIIKTKIKTEEKTLIGKCDPYFAAFLRGETYRESCYNCKYANLDRVGDLTIGDFWGVNNFYPNVPTKQGVSICIINSDKGKKLFDLLKETVTYFPCKKEEIIKENHNLQHPTFRPKVRDIVYNGIDDLPSNKFFSHFLYQNINILKMKRIIKRLFRGI